jgi:2-polyprenyl-3-methyl-5-hydroxy-6-metoxy-1,4-benzoquinol methylase
MALLRQVSGRSVLEVGCDAGPLTEYLVECGAAVSAIDVSAEMVRLAQARVGDRARFLVANLEEPLSLAQEALSPDFPSSACALARW